MLRAYKGTHPRVHPTAYVDASAQVIGDVEIGEASSVWMNVVFAATCTGSASARRTNVQDGTIVHVMRGTHPTTIGDEVTIGHGAIVHGCTMHDRVLDRHGRDPAERRGGRRGLDRRGRHAAAGGHADPAAIAGDGQSRARCGAR